METLVKKSLNLCTKKTLSNVGEKTKKSIINKVVSDNPKYKYKLTNYLQGDQCHFSDLSYEFIYHRSFRATILLTSSSFCTFIWR